MPSHTAACLQRASLWRRKILKEENILNFIYVIIVAVLIVINIFKRYETMSHLDYLRFLLTTKVHLHVHNGRRHS